MNDKVMRLLKQDVFGRIELVERDATRLIRRSATGGNVPGTRILARLLASREQRTLARLREVEGVPRPLGTNGSGVFYRSYIEGAPLYEAGKMVSAGYWEELLSLAESCHAAGVVHNDLAKEANVLVTSEGRPAFIDFQLAAYVPADSPPPIRQVAAMLRREDRRHLLKHKALYRPDLLSASERAALANKSLPTRMWSATAMKPYQRVIVWLGWEEARGPQSR